MRLNFKIKLENKYLPFVMGSIFILSLPISIPDKEKKLS